MLLREARALKPFYWCLHGFLAAPANFLESFWMDWMLGKSGKMVFETEKWHWHAGQFCALVRTVYDIEKDDLRGMA